MPPRKFDRYMVGLGAGRHIKFRRLTVPERYAFFMGVLSLAAQSPVRGCLVIGSLPVEPADVAAEADVPERVAASALEKLRAVNVIERHADGFDWVHDFDDWNPAPKDPTGADRQQRYRDRHRNGDVTRYVTAENAVTGRDASRAEVKREVEEEKPLAPSAPRSRGAIGPDSHSSAESVACPRCGAGVGEKCDAARGGKRESYHLERHHAVGEMTHITGKPRSSARPSLAALPVYRGPASDAVAMHAEHFPDEAVEAVDNSISMLVLARKPVTVEAVRALLYGEAA